MALSADDMLNEDPDDASTIAAAGAGVNCENGKSSNEINSLPVQNTVAGAAPLNSGVPATQPDDGIGDLGDLDLGGQFAERAKVANSSESQVPHPDAPGFGSVVSGPAKSKTVPEAKNSGNSQTAQASKAAEKGKGKGGRPAWVMPDLAQVEALAAHGLNRQQIAASLGMGEATMYEKMKLFPEFADALNRGKAKGIATVAARLMANIRAGKEASIFFYLKCQANWREMPTQVELTGADGTPLLPALAVSFVDPEVEGLVDEGGLLNVETVGGRH